MAVAMRNKAQKEEMNAKHAFEMLEQSLQNTIKQDQKELAASKATKAGAEEAKSVAEGDLSMAEKELASDEKYLSDLSTDCQQKATDWEVSTKSRADELQALADAKKLILEKTGGAEARAYDFIQQETKSRSTSDAGEQVVSLLQSLGKREGDVALGQLALRIRAATQMASGADPFAKVKGMISEMIDKLVQQAAEEASHKAFCDKEMDEIRADQKAAFADAKKEYEEGIEGLTMALQILRDYYAEKEDSSALLQQPEVSTHSKASGAATGIIGLLEVSQSDFSKLLADATVEEEASAKEYEKISQENRVSTAMKDADVKYMTKEVASLEKSVSEMTSDIQAEQTELDAVLDYYEKLKPGCIAKPMTYDERKKRREAEIAGLKEALVILEGETPAAFLAVRSTLARRHS